jgi:hypothetical protein
MDPETSLVKRLEFKAPDRHAAERMIDVWAAVERKTITSRVLLADGVTFLEAGKLRITGLAMELSNMFKASVTGPFEFGYGSAPGWAVRVIMRNGYGVSIATGGPHKNDPPPVIEFTTCHDDGTYVRWDVCPDVLMGGQRGTEDGSTDLDEIVAVMRKLPQP